MPITINGDGTITGYTPPIADGSITSAKLASGVGGKVLQIQKTLVTAISQITCSNGSGFSGSHDSALTVSITPTSEVI